MIGVRYLLVINPDAQLGISRRTQKRLIQLAEKFLGEGEVFIVGKNKKGWKSTGFETIIFCGGDGTLSRGIQQIYPEQVKVGIVPLGSGRDFASSLGISKNPKIALSIIAKGKTKWVDLGRVNDYFFVNTVSFGFDAFINQLQETKTRPKMKWMKWLKQQLFLPLDAKWCYLLAILYYLLGWDNFEPPEIKITTKGFAFSGRVYLLTITNSFRYGGGLKINPDAKVDDGVLDACLLPPLNKLEFFEKIYSTYKGTHIFDPRIKTFQFEKMIIQSEKPLVCQADGETLTPSRLFEVEVVKRGLKVFVP
ncbi:MAG: diacylglycerol kinase family lipid kinase [Candidatus Pacebacteria bacterium]|nr:diacylglycerol kinase family lipid kinase [Candidatus Paceibacterota bacterium]